MDVQDLTITLPDGTRMRFVPDEPDPPAVPLEVGMSWKSEDKDAKAGLPAPAFRRLFMQPGAGMPKATEQTPDMRTTPRSTVPWWSHKDLPAPAAIAQTWGYLTNRYPGRVIRWTFDHEANDKPYDRHVQGWKALRALRDSDPAYANIRLCTIITGYYARYRSLGDWRRYVLPELVDEVDFDLYAHIGYEDPASIFGIVDQAQSEFGIDVGLAEVGAPIIGNDAGHERAEWLLAGYQHALRRRYRTFGLWASYEYRDGVKYDYRPHDTATRTAYAQILSGKTII